jgi:hypothetical protein
MNVSKVKYFSLLFLFLLTLLSSIDFTRAQGIIPFAHWKSRYLQFNTSAQTINPNACSAAVTVQLTLGGVAVKPQGASMTINYATTGTLTVYSDPACVTPITSSTLTVSFNSVTVYVMAISVGANTITASAAQVLPSTQTEASSVSNFIWTGTTNNTWSVGTNWSGGAAPAINDVAVFDGSCVTNCSPNITTSISVGGVSILSGFSGTITRGWAQAAGTFTGSSSGDAISINGSTSFMKLTGGTFKGTSGTFTVSIALTWYVNGGTFNGNGGTLYFATSTGAGNVTPGASSTYSNFNIGSGSWTFGSDMTMTGNLIFSSTNVGRYLSGQTINVAGNITVTGQGEAGSTLLNLNGGASQSIDCSAATNCNLPGVKISSTGGTLSLIGNLIVGGDWIYSTGTLSIGMSNLKLNFLNGASFAFGAGTYNDVYFNGTGNFNSAAISGSLTLSGTLTFTSTFIANTLTGGTINAKGPITILNNGVGGTTSVIVNGSTGQVIDGSGATGNPALGVSEMPPLTIASTGGTVTLTGVIAPDSSYTYSSGIMAVSGSTLYPTAPSGNVTFTGGGITYNNVSLYSKLNATTRSIVGNLDTTGNVTESGGSASHTDMPNPGGAYHLTVGGTLTVNKTLNMNGAARSQTTLVNNGTINP